MPLHSPGDEHLDYLQFRVVMNKAASNIHVQNFVWSNAFIFSGKDLGVGLLVYF